MWPGFLTLTSDSFNTTSNFTKLFLWKKQLEIECRLIGYQCSNYLFPVWTHHSFKNIKTQEDGDPESLDLCNGCRSEEINSVLINNTKRRILTSQKISIRKQYGGDIPTRKLFKIQIYAWGKFSKCYINVYTDWKSSLTFLQIILQFMHGPIF